MSEKNSKIMMKNLETDIFSNTNTSLLCSVKEEVPTFQENDYNNLPLHNKKQAKNKYYIIAYDIKSYRY